MAEPKAKPRGPREMRLVKEMWGVFGVSIVFFLLWGWLTSIDAVAWLHPFLLAVAVICGLVGVVHWVMMEMLRHGFKQ